MSFGPPQTPFSTTEGGRQPGGADPRLEQQIVESYLARMEQTLEARVDQQVARRLRAESQSPARHFTSRLAGSLAVGIPLTAVAGGIASAHGSGGAAPLAIIAVFALIFGLNVYYTEAEKDIEKERLKHLP